MLIIFILIKIVKKLVLLNALSLIMSKLKIKLIFLGNPPLGVNIARITNWKSDLFQIIQPIGKVRITKKADLPDWAFSDKIIGDLLPEEHDGEILIAITSIPLEENYYVRRIENNRLCATFFEIGDFLKYNNIPLENFILRVLYATSITYKRFNNRVPITAEITNFTHDETRGCIFDMNGIKDEIIYSTNKPIICDACVNSIANEGVETNLLDSVQKELKGVRKSLYYRIADLIKEYPVCAIILSSTVAILLGVIGSVIASYLWEAIIKKWFCL